MSGITSHVLDTGRGKPAAAVALRLEAIMADGTARVLSRAVTNGDGRVSDLLAGEGVAAGVYRLVFATGPYFHAQGLSTFYPEVIVVFELGDGAQHCHVPLLLSPFGYSTYRGS